ncbi:unnamed protein product [Chironomus riparius]|uniref:Uncharacterized protein n=1 Tax=Chironomus riparius TaxID=315576 RepID=A0A9N9S9W2_9DIPT|nr:unnamed protein product [Chironomus riparius]
MILQKDVFLCCLIGLASAGSPSYTEFFTSSSSSSSQYYPDNGPPCVTCNDAFMNNQFSLMECNPQGRPKYSIAYKLTNSNALFSGFCTDFLSSYIPSEYILYYATDGFSQFFDYYLDMSSSPSYTVTPPSSSDSASSSNTFETFGPESSAIQMLCGRPTIHSGVLETHHHYSSSSGRYPDTNGPLCITCYDALINNQLLSDSDCNPNGQWKVQVNFADSPASSKSGYCVNFGLVANNYETLPTSILWIYVTDGHIHYDYFGRTSSSPIQSSSSSTTQDTDGDFKKLNAHFFGGSPAYLSSSAIDNLPCETCYDVYINNKPFSSYECNPNGQRKFLAGFANLEVVYSDGYCVNFEDIANNYDALPNIYLWVYATDGETSYDYFGKSSSTPSLLSESSNTELENGNFW